MNKTTKERNFKRNCKAAKGLVKISPDTILIKSSSHKCEGGWWWQGEGVFVGKREQERETSESSQNAICNNAFTVFFGLFRLSVVNEGSYNYYKETARL